jgi:tol-pal system protein YbgF
MELRMKSRLHRVLLTGFLAVLFAAPVLAQQAPAPGTGSNYETRLESLEDQMRTLNGNIEQLGFSIRQLQQSMQRMQSDTEARLARLEAAQQQQQQQASVVVNPPPPAPSSPSVPIAAPASAAADNEADEEPPPPTAPVKGTLGAIKMQDGKVTGAVNNPQAPPLPQTPPDYGLSPQEQYDRAFDLLRQTNYEDASDAFKSFIDKNPKDKLIEDAKYWYGETLYVQDKFDSAALAFADAYQQNPNGAKAPDSLLKLAMSLGKLGKTSDACTTLDSLKSKYPKAPIKIRQNADQERINMKCGAQQQGASSKAQ